MLAHRYSYELHYGLFDPERLVCHHCDNPSCVRPDHLYLGDAQTNADDKMARGRHAGANKTACRNGHEFTATNTYLYHGKRKCRECDRARHRKSTTTK